MNRLIPKNGKYFSKIDLSEDTILLVKESPNPLARDLYYVMLGATNDCYGRLTSCIGRTAIQRKLVKKKSFQKSKDAKSQIDSAIATLARLKLIESCNLTDKQMLKDHLVFRDGKNTPTWFINTDHKEILEKRTRSKLLKAKREALISEIDDVTPNQRKDYLTLIDLAQKAESLSNDFSELKNTINHYFGDITKGYRL